jgi:transcriptional regulator with XRE-family HTH domain
MAGAATKVNDEMPMNRKSKKAASATQEPKARPKTPAQEPKARSKTPFARNLTELREKLRYTQEKLAEKLGVNPGTVARWETETKADEEGGYKPSTDMLVKFAALLAEQAPSSYYDDRCRWLLEIAKAWNQNISDALARESRRRLAPRQPKSGDIVRVPLLEVSVQGITAEGGTVVSGAEPTCDIPAWLVTDPTSIICARASSSLFPFSSGDTLLIDRAESDLWQLAGSGSVVAVHFTRFPEILPLNVDQSYIQQRHERVAKVELAQVEKEHSIRRQILEQSGSEESLRQFDAHDADAAELGKRFTPDEAGTFALEKIQAGWLSLEIAGSPEFAILGDREYWPTVVGPWRMVLQAARVRGVTATDMRIPLTEWSSREEWGRRLSEGLHDSRGMTLLGHVKVLGRVISWWKK